MVQIKETKGQIISTRPSVARMVEEIVGCKWSLEILDAVRKDVVRPGAIQHSIEGLSTKVLNERLSKMIRYRILTKETFSEVPPRVEYKLSHFGKKFIGILDQIEKLQSEVSNGH